MRVEFTGFSERALDFYEDLEIDNTKSFWDAHKHVWQDEVRAPMAALTGALAAEFGAAKLFRPHRDVRFSKDKTPYKIHQGAFVGTAPATGWYVELSAAGLRVGGGFYHADAARLSAIRAAIDADKTGTTLVRIVRKLEGSGFTVSGDRLKTAPRNYAKDHPRIELLRHKYLFCELRYGFDGLHSPELVERVRTDWRSVRPLVRWLEAIRTD